MFLILLENSIIFTLINKLNHAHFRLESTHQQCSIECNWTLLRKHQQEQMFIDCLSLQSLKDAFRKLTQKDML